MGRKLKRKQTAQTEPTEESNPVKRSLEDDSDEPNAKEPRIESEAEAEVVESKPIEHNRRARLIVRNLSFKTTEDKLRAHFSQFGELTDVKLLTRPDGSLVGCGFVEYKLTQKAAKAIANTSGQPFLNRPIVVDWAIPKNEFIQKTGKDKSTEDSEKSGFNGDLEEGENEEKFQVKKESDEDSDGGVDQSDESRNDDDENEDEDDNYEDEDDENEDEDEDKEEVDKFGRRKPRRESHDLSEGCTVFVKSIPFSVDNREFKKCMQEFGHVYYALVCIDPLTEHSKGTGFAKFKSKESAEACIEAGGRGEIILQSSVLEVQRALSREEVNSGKKKDNTKKDGRNLYLIKEGVILAGSKAAAGVSQADMAKRLQLEQWKTQMLRNLNKFVSRNRLVIQNLPANYDDLQLKSLCLKYGGQKPVITEARVMKDLRNVDASGKGKSKEYGFVSFTTHENALQALRNINNNPNIFSASRRPIVAFSIEDRVALNARHKRLEKSKAFNQQHVNQKDWEKKRGEKKMKGNVKVESNGISSKEQQTTQSLNKSQKKQLNKLAKQAAGEIKGKVVVENGAQTIQEKEETQKLTKNQKKRLKRLALQEGGATNKITPQPAQPQPGGRKERRKLRLQQELLKISQRANQRQRKPAVTDSSSGRTDYVGETGKPGQTRGMSKQTLREQAQLHHKSIKVKNKNERVRKQQASVKIKQPKQKMGTFKDLRKEDNFSKLVSKYKNQLFKTADLERKKWYE